MCRNINIFVCMFVLCVWVLCAVNACVLVRCRVCFCAGSCVSVCVCPSVSLFMFVSLCFLGCFVPGFF